MAHSNNKVVRYDATRYNFFDGTKYSRSHGYNDEIVTFEIDGKKRVLPKAVVKLLELIFDKTSIDRFLNENKITPSILDSPQKLLTGVLGAALGIPSTMVGLLNDWFFMQDARTIMKECENDPNKIFQYYTKLKTKIRPLEKNCDEYKKIVQYVKNSHGPTHSKYRLEVMEVFKVSRRGEFSRYKTVRDEIDFKKLLWHGSRLANFASILLRGLQIAPHQAQKTGSMFGEGIYFADCITKSANYCGTDKNNPIGLVLLAEVAIGNTYKLTKDKNVTKLPKGKNSVKAYGKMQPDRKYHEYTKFGVQVPMGRPIKIDVNSCLQYNEYIVYSPDPILLQYLIQLKFIYD